MSKKTRTAIDTLQFLMNKPTIETGATRKINTILEKAQADSSMIGIIGEEGIGKSTGAGKHVLTSQNVYYIRMGQSYRSKTLFHELVFLITGKHVYQSTNLNNTIDYLSELLNESPEKKLVVIDDAGKLKATGLGLFHELRENTMATTGFAFMGLQYFMDNLLQWRKEGKVGIAEFYRRVNFWFSLPYLTEQEKLHYLQARRIDLTEKVRAILKEVKTIWELESRINIHLEYGKGKRRDVPQTLSVAD